MVDLGSVTNSAMSGAASFAPLAYNVILFLFIGTFIFVTGWYWLMFRKRRLIIFEQDSTGRTRKKTEAIRRISNIKGETADYVRRWYRRSSRMKPIPDMYWSLCADGVMEAQCVVREGKLLPLKLEDRPNVGKDGTPESLALTSDEQDSVMFNLYETKYTNEKYKDESWIERFMPIIAVTIVMIIFFFGMVIIAGKFEDTGKLFAQTAQNLASCGAQLARSTVVPGA